jgi:hypothetical protein
MCIQLEAHQTSYSLYEFLIRLDTNWCKDIKCTTFEVDLTIKS